jgi:hypothetical protein
MSGRETEELSEKLVNCIKCKFTHNLRNIVIILRPVFTFDSHELNKLIHNCHCQYIIFPVTDLFNRSLPILQHSVCLLTFKAHENQC